MAMSGSGWARQGRRGRRIVPDRLWTHLTRLVRYGAVSIVSSMVGLAVLGYLVAVRGTSAGWANVISTTVAAVPSFELNRRWSWQGRSGRAKLDQVVPFLVMTFVGLGLSTYVVHLAGLIATEHELHTVHRTVAIEGASVGTWAALWLLQYFILDRYLFRPLVADPAWEPPDLVIDPVDAAEAVVDLLEADTATIELPDPPVARRPGPVADALVDPVERPPIDETPQPS